jgi:GH15 family glucan-1,4-alpha-glucosidase
LFFVLGHFSITPAFHTSNKQQYLPRSNVLVTRFLSDKGVSEITDYMHIPNSHSTSTEPILPWLVRHVSVVRGEVDFLFELFPSFNYALDDHTIEVDDEYASDNKEDSTSYVGKRFIFRSNTLNMDLRYVVSDGEKDPPNINLREMKKDVMKGPGITSRFTLSESQEITFIFRELPNTKGVLDPPINAALMKRLFRQTLTYWQDWISQSCYRGRWRENVHRSALTLKLLTYEPVRFGKKKYIYYINFFFF